MLVSLRPYRVKVSTVVRALVSHHCGVDFNPAEAVMSVEFVVGSCNGFKRVFSKHCFLECSCYFSSRIVISMFKFS